VWLDDDAVELGEISTAGREAKSGGASEIPPIARGFSEGARSAAAAAEDRERIELYKQIKRELGEGEVSLWNLVDEVDLTFPRNVNIRLAASPVTVVVGGKDFRHRFDTALQILEAIKRGDQDALARYRVQEAERLIANADLINFMDASRPERIVLNFSSPGTEKPLRQEKALRQEAGSQSTPRPPAIARAPKKEQAKDSKKDPKKETRPRQATAIKR
jgi:hypothetical protein